MAANDNDKIKFFEKQLKARIKQRKSIQNDITQLQDVLFKLEGLPKLKKMIGRCYKTRNCYSCPENPSDYWWLYTQVLKIESSDFCCVNDFQKDTDGRIDFRFNTIKPINSLTSSDYKEITPKEYNREKKKLMDFIKEQ